MRIPVFAYGVSPHTSAPLYWEKQRLLGSLLARKRVLHIDGHYHKAADSRTYKVKDGEFNAANVDNYRHWKPVQSGHMTVLQMVNF